MKFKKLLTIGYIAAFASIASAQQTDSVQNTYKNTADLLLEQNQNLQIGGYGEVHFNKPIQDNTHTLGTADVHRIVLFTGYSFSEKTHFVSEIEFEYAKELWVEQAFLQHSLHKYAQFRAGLLLVPMGIINEYHEPSTFNGVERPIIDNKLSLSTWREIGFGLTGTIVPYSLKYQAYVVNGLNGYDSKAVFTGDKGLREGRQKGSKAYTTSPSVTGKVEYFGFPNLNIGLSGYVGTSQSKLYASVNKDSVAQVAKADSSTVDIVMWGADVRYKKQGVKIRGQVYYTNVYNTAQYNVFNTKDGNLHDLGKAMLGYYAEIGYNVLTNSTCSRELIPFVRYEFYNMHHKVSHASITNPAFKNTHITAGLTYKIHQNAVIKTDILFAKSAIADVYSKTINAGIGVMF